MFSLFVTLAIQPKNAMARNNRILKTLNRKLRDLDDHLFFLKESLAKLSSGDISYQKTLTVELRVLVCESSGTEGLLWRLMDELNVHDAVHIHFPGNLDKNHPLVKSIQFNFVPIFRAGQGDPILKPQHYSLKKIIKEWDANVVSGVGHTFDILIRDAAQQMGSAHEDEGVDPYLIELSGIVFSDQSALNAVFLTVADLVLEVGERVLNEAFHNLGFNKSSRPEIVLPGNLVRTYQDATQVDFEVGDSTISSVGTFMFWMDFPDPDWATNTNRYDYSLIKYSSLSIRTIKHSDKSIEVQVEGLANDIITTRKPIPVSLTHNVMVSFSWNINEIKFYLNGVRVDSKKFDKRSK